MSKMKRRFAVITALFCVSAATPLLVPFSIGTDGNLNTIGYMTGGVFWAGLVGGIIGYILLNRGMKSREEMKDKGEAAKKERLPSALQFFRNPPAGFGDAALIVGAIGTVWCLSNARAPAALAVACLLLLLIGIYAHFLLNGAMFQYIWTHRSEKSEGAERKEQENEEV